MRKHKATAVLGLLILAPHLLEGPGWAAGQKSNGSLVITDDLPTGSAGSVGLTGGTLELTGGLGQTAVLETDPGASVIEAGFFSKMVLAPFTSSLAQIYATSASFNWSDSVPPNPSGTVYRVEVSTTADFSGVVRSSETFLFTSTVTDLAGNTTYYARFRVTYSESDDQTYPTFSTAATLAAQPSSPFFSYLSPFSFVTAWNTGGNSSAGSPAAWTAQTDTLPVALYGHAIALHDGKLYVSGGFGTALSSAVYFASIQPDGTVGPWTETTPLPQARESHAMAAWGGRLYVAGGFNGSARTTVWWAPINEDGSVGAWTTTTSLPAARHRHTLSAHDGFLYITGGDNGVVSQATVYAAPLDGAGGVGNWSTTTVLPAARSGHAACVVGGRAYVAGGLGAGAESTVWHAALNGTSVGAWSTTTQLPTTLFRHAMACSSDRLYVAGGHDGSNDSAEVYSAAVSTDASVGNWTRAVSLPAARLIHAMAIRGHRLYITGGSDGASPTDTVWVSSLTGTEYFVELAKDAAFTVDYASSSWQSGTVFEFASLTPNTTYYSRVKARNLNQIATGDSPTISTLTLAAAPLPASPAFTAVELSSITAQWGLNGNPSGTEFRLQASTSSGFGGTLLSSGWEAVTSTPVFSLSANTSYYFRVQSRNSAQVPSPAVVLGSTYTLAAVPANTLIRDVLTTGFTLEWSTNANPAGTRFQAQVSANPSFATLDATDLTVSSYSVFSGLLSATTFYARVRALNQDGIPSSFDAPVSTFTGGDSVPPGISTGAFAYQSGNTSALLAVWAAPGDDGYSGGLVAGSRFLLQWTDDPASVVWSTANAQVNVATGPVAAGARASYDVTGLPSPKEITMRVWTRDEAGSYSAPSDTFSAFAAPFSFETVDGAGIDAGERPSLAVDRSGNLHAAFRGGSGAKRLRYAKRTGTTWSAAVDVDASAAVDNISIAVDIADQPQILYRDTTAGALKLARFSGTWSMSVVETGNFSPGALALAPDGKAHAAYYDGANGNLKYGRWTGLAWSTETVDSGGDVGLYASLALDGAVRPHIAYYDKTNGDLKYSSWTGTAWGVTVVDGAGVDVGSTTAIALDGNDRAHIAYGDSSAPDIRYSSWSGTAWSAQIVDSAGNQSRVGGLALDGNGRPLISYNNGSSSLADLKFSSWTGTFWSSSTVDSLGEQGLESSLAVDGTGGIHILYSDRASNDLKAAHGDTNNLVARPMGGNARGRAQAPASFSGASASLSQIQWTWTNGATNAIGFRLYGADTSTGPFTLIVGTDTIGGSAVTYLESGLTLNTTYYRYIAAVNTGGVVASSMAFAYPVNAVDISSPTITVNQTGDNLWRRINNGVYNVDFLDTGGSSLSRFEVKASTVPGGIGPDMIDFTDAQTGINQGSYTTDWPLPNEVFLALADGATNYITIRVTDGVGNSTTQADVFYVRKDTTAPLLADNQPGDDTVRGAAGTTYDVDALDGSSGLSRLQYSASLAANTADAALIGWTDVASVSNSTSYTTNWTLDFNSLASVATNYISVRVWDAAGSTRTLTDAFKVFKDTMGPTVAITAPASPFHSALATISGTALERSFAGLLGTEVSIESAGAYWDGVSGFTSVTPVWLAASGTGTWTLAPGINWADGSTYQVVARSSDSVGNYSPTYSTKTFVFDSAAPAAEVTLPAGGTISSLTLISGTSADPGASASGVASVLLQLRRLSDLSYWNFGTETGWTSNPVSTVTTGTNPWSLTPSELLKANLENNASYFILLSAQDNASPANATAFGLTGATFTFTDATPPAAVSDLSGNGGSSPGDILLSWTAPGDDGSSGTILLGAYRIQYSTDSAASFSTASAQVAFTTATVVPGSAQSRLLTSFDGLTAGATYFLRLWTADDAGNWSALSSGATVQATPAPINEIRGTVKKDSVQGVTAVLLEAFDASNALVSSAFSVADGSGSFILSGLPAGLYRLQASWTADGITSSVWQDNIAMGTIGIDFILNLDYTLSTLTGSLNGITTSGSQFAARAQSSHFADSRVELYQNGRKVAEARVSPVGRWNIGDLLPGRYAVRAYNGLEFTEMQDVDLLDGETKEVGFAFNPLPEDSAFVFPNPAKNQATFRFITALYPIEAQVQIFDITGALVKEIPGSDMSSPGPYLYHADWDLKNASGEDVASGVYLFMIKVRGGEPPQSARVIKKLAVVR